MTEDRSKTKRTPGSIVCPVCFHHCTLAEGQTGRCLARQNCGGQNVPVGYGRLTSLALDPIEKKPLYHFQPGSVILSVGSFGCNLSCPFCQNHEIAKDNDVPVREMTPEALVELAVQTREEYGSIGVAFTYNEPLVSYEYLRDCGRLLHERGLCCVAVTNGSAEPAIFDEVLSVTDAMNIDLKCFDADGYRRLGGELAVVRRSIEAAHAAGCHIELTTLIVPGISGDPAAMRDEARWIASIDPEIPLHITRYFPRYRMHAPATDVGLLHELSRIAESYLSNVHIGNV